MSTLQSSTPEADSTIVILLVEDDNAIREGLASILELYLTDYHMTILEATNGAEGLARLANAQPDLIISDIRMPVMDGFEFLEKVRLQPGLIHTPFIFLTAAGSEEAIYRGRLSGAELYITKPIADNQAFVEEVRGQIELSRHRRVAREQRMGALKRELLRKLQHEFRTPLNLVTAFYEILADSIQSTQNPLELVELLNGIEVGSRRLRKLVEDLSLILELRTGAAQARLADQAGVIEQPSGLFQAVVLRQAPELARKHIRLTLNLPTAWPPIWGHPDSLADVCERLLDNAVKFTERKAEAQRHIEVWGESNTQAICLHVRDSGIGFPSDVADKLFEAFYQHNRDRLEQQGVGIGLAIVKALVMWHGGTIEAAGDDGQGCHFTVVLPIYRPELGVPPPGQAARRAVSVLLVEDDADQLEGLAELMLLDGRRYQYRVKTAANGEEALQCLARAKPDLILADIGMPGLDGYELLQRVRAREEWVELPFIFLTGHTDARDIHRGRQFGVDEYITKPYKPDEFFGIVETVLARTFARQEHSVDDFEQLKQGVLASLNRGVWESAQGVSGYTQEITRRLEDVTSVDELSEALAGLRQGSRRLTYLVEDFTSLVEIQTGPTATGYQPHMGPIEQPGWLWQEAWEQIKDSAEFLHLPAPDLNLPDLPPLHGDGAILVKALRALLRFSLETLPPTTPFVLSGVKAESELCLFIQVTQATLPAAQRAEIQHLLTTSPTLPSNAHSTAATMLSIARHLIELHAGRLLFAPTPDGYRFEVYLPLLAGE